MPHSLVNQLKLTTTEKNKLGKYTDYVKSVHEFLNDAIQLFKDIWDARAFKAVRQEGEIHFAGTYQADEH